jgi:glucose/arabinose dehydrogenase
MALQPRTHHNPGPGILVRAPAADSLRALHLKRRALTRCVLAAMVAVLVGSCAPAPQGAVVASIQVPLWRSSWRIDADDSLIFALRAVPYATGLELPTTIGHATDGSGRFYVAQQRGTIAVIEDGVVLPTPFIDLRDRTSCCGEQGLLGFATDPAFVTNGFVYVGYTDLSGDSVVARYRTIDGGRHADPGSEVIVLSVAQPGPAHNGGALAFGHDGFLYASFGDGGYAVAPKPTAGRTDTLLGKVIRIDVRELPYRVPRDNPLARVDGARGEIWALGLRNPWRMSFDRLTGDLYVGDVGQSRWEEINVVPSGVGGLDFGWPVMEGPACRNFCTEPVGEPPAVAYGRDVGCSVTGGHVYRGAALPRLQGTYLYGDFCSGRVWGARSSEGVWEHALIFDTAANISAFGEDEAGELYFTDYGMGVLYRIVDASDAWE